MFELIDLIFALLEGAWRIGRWRRRTGRSWLSAAVVVGSIIVLLGAEVGGIRYAYRRWPW